MAKNGTMKIIGFAVSILGGGILIYNSFHVPLARAITSECEARTVCDKEISDKLTEAVLDQKEVNQQILISLAKLDTKMEYIKQKVR